MSIIRIIVSTQTIADLHRSNTANLKFLTLKIRSLGNHHLELETLIDHIKKNQILYFQVRLGLMMPLSTSMDSIHIYTHMPAGSSFGIRDLNRS